MKKLKSKSRITIPVEIFLYGIKGSSLKQKRLQKAAAKTAKELHLEHFSATSKNQGGWPIDFNLYVHDVFYNAYKESLQSYLAYELSKLGTYELKIIDGRWLLCKGKDVKKKNSKKNK